MSHHAQTKHRTQSYTNKKGQVTYNEYNTKKGILTLKMKAVCSFTV
jgi:hypothetical protein